MALRLTGAAFFLRNLAGGSQSKLIAGEDGNLYVVKFKNNPQGNNSILNEALGILLAKELGLPVPEIALMNVPKPFITNQNLYLQFDGNNYPCDDGPQLAIKLAVHPARGRIFDMPDASAARSADNSVVLEFAELFDWWTCNIDRRQFVAWRSCRERKIHLTLIDFGFCFGGPDHDWNKRPSCTMLKLTTASSAWWNQLVSWDCSRVYELMKDLAALIPANADTCVHIVDNLIRRRESLLRVMHPDNMVDSVFDKDSKTNGDSKTKCQRSCTIAGSAKSHTQRVLPSLR